MFSWISKFAGKPARANDQDFGKLTYMGGYWEGQGTFPVTGGKVEYFITADEHGPSAANRIALHKIYYNYTELASKAASAISAMTGTIVPTSELVISSLDVPSSDLDESVWEINFSHTSGALFSVKFCGLEATGEVDASN